MGAAKKAETKAKHTPASGWSSADRIGLLVAVSRDMERDLIVSAIRGCALETRECESTDGERGIREALRDVADRIERGEIARGES